ncbi:MAG: S41 family peptidase [Acidobacteriota bacterium]|nr:S41 family peptidase [Acidobacteriota bacterium]
MAQRRRSLLFFPLIVLLCSLAGGLYGPRLQVASAASSEDDINKSAKSFTKVYGLVEENFADPLNADKAIYNGAIPGMLRTLDPHSSFFDPHEFQIMRESQKGSYYGIGMRVKQQFDGKTIVFEPFKGSPAFKAGLRPGDIIAAVNNKPTDKMSLSDVADMLKGPRGTTVKITIQREGSQQPLTFEVVRDGINRKSVPDAIMLRAGVYYLYIEQFNETTSSELEDNLRKIGENNIKGLILDLRFNPGGLLNEAVAVSDKFLNKGDVIVSHHGRASAEKVYTAKNGNHGHDFPMVVLVNRSSASASEIVSGALQDHDRAWILGDTTFGKGLVQTVYPLVENTGLALTTAKYYTPSGRLIQRDYSNLSFFDYYQNKTEIKNPQDVKMTDSGRTVYGGGGITPDEKYVSPKLDKLESQLLGKQEFFNFTRHYFGVNGINIKEGWSPDNIIMTEFHDYMLKNAVQFTEAEFAQDQDWLKRQLEHEMYWTAFSSDNSRIFDVQTDPAVAKAVEALPKAKVLLDSARKVIVQRMAK